MWFHKSRVGKTSVPVRGTLKSTTVQVVGFPKVGNKEGDNREVVHYRFPFANLHKNTIIFFVCFICIFVLIL
jgi:hypothetical protein